VKKFFLAILALVYISTSIGATVHVHYCMGKLAEWGVGHKESSSCDKCGMAQSIKKANGCCKDENKFIKNSADQKGAEAAFQTFQSVAITPPVAFIELPAVTIFSVAERNPCSHAPPRDSGVAVYIRNCVFRI
jgi:hypothetical protein